MIVSRDDYFTPVPDPIEVKGIFEAYHCGVRASPAWFRNKFKGWTCAKCLLWFPARFPKERKVRHGVSQAAFAFYE